MNILIVSLILALGVSADALACGFSAGAGRIRVPLGSACAAAAVSAAVVLVGMVTGNLSAPYLPASVQKYLSFGILAVFGLLKLAASGDGNPAFADCNSDKRLSTAEGVALGVALSIDGLAAGFGLMASVPTVLCSGAFTFVCTAAALWLGAKSGRGASGRAGNIAAGLALAVLAAEKLIFA